MSWLVYLLGTSGMEPDEGEAIEVVVRYHRTHPTDTYGDALIVPCEFFPDGRSEPKAHLPAEGQPQ